MLDELNASLNLMISQTKQNAPILEMIVGVLWGCYFLTRVCKPLLYLGIMPRRMYGLPGIIFSPFLHANFNHLFLNTIPLVVLSDFLLLNGLTYFLWVTLIITLVSGFLVWCIAKPGIHIGASGVITGYWGLLMVNIYQQGTLTAIILGLLCVYYFAGIFYGIFPGAKNVSWEGHLCGLIAGLGTGYFASYWMAYVGLLLN